MNSRGAKKSLGQHFLKSKQAITHIADAAELTEKDIVLEIGPGKGVLTEVLLKQVERVVAIEKDDALCVFLKEKFQEEIETGRLILIHGDVLSFNPAYYKKVLPKYKIVANIPYYITGKVLRDFLSTTHKPERMVLLIQKEVAERIVTRHQKESMLSISVQVYGKPKYIKTVPKKYFSPQPKVDSAIILIENIRSPFQTRSKEKKFFEILRKGFSHKRKLLKKNLNISGKKLEGLEIPENARPEDLKKEQWLAILQNL